VEGDFWIGEWLVHPTLNTVHCDGRDVRIEHKMMQVLVCLANRPGEVHSKEELIRTVWKDTFVSDEVLTRAISELRRVFLDDAKQPQIIQTVAKSGYRILAPVRPLVDKLPPRTWSRKLIPVLLLLVFTGSILTFVLYNRSSRRKADAALIRSIAVLPLTNLSHDPEQEYFADGMTEALINDLSKIGTLRVISRTSVMQYKATRKPLPDIARELKVDAIVEGSVQRSGDRVRISTQLIDGKSDEHLWARDFDRDLKNVLMLESEVAQAVAGEIRLGLTPADVARIPSAHVVSRKAHDAFLRGRYLWSSRRSKRELEQSITFYQQAIDEDPQYALAYAGMADSYAVLEDNGQMSASEANPRIKTAAIKAVEADPTLAEAHMMLADAKETEWDWAGAEQEYKRAIDLNPGLARAHHWYAVLLSTLKRHDEAISEIERAVDLEPLTPKLYVIRSIVYYFAGHYEQALKTLNESPTLKATDRAVRILSAKIDLRTGDYTTALSKIRAVMDSDPGDSKALALLGYSYAIAGRKKQALAALDELSRLGRQEYVNPGSIAMIWVGLGDKNKALTLLDEDYRLHSSFLMYLGDPVFEPLHSDKRFQDLLRRIGLPSN
jgi:TolB-like protein/DNA-binding winged helix-turn-helix (wHTH) protein/Flp pilus assembly protein TadD